MESRCLLESAEAELRRRFGAKAELKPKQREILIHLAESRSVFAGLPTGYGKSLCFWLPAAAWKWRVWVISPLLSLMEDQFNAMKSLGLRAISVHGSLGEQERGMMDDLRSGDWEILFLTPEQLVAWHSNGLLTMLGEAGLGPDLLAFDEMHCLEEWKEFRVSLASVFPPIRRLVTNGARFLGLSASFAREDRQLWMSEFIDTYSVVELPLGRENLSLFVLPLENGALRWLLLLTALRELREPQSALVYCASRKECDLVTTWLRSAGIDATSYHAGLPVDVRKARSHGFRRGALKVVCATSAFGMGIDYPHVERVIHFSLPFSLESYWQEAGRAGRSGGRAYSIVFWRRSEIARLRILSPRARVLYVALWRAFLRGGCRVVAVAKSLGTEASECGNCDECRREGVGLPDWLSELRSVQTSSPWWLKKSAEPENWIDENIFWVSKNS